MKIYFLVNKENGILTHYYINKKDVKAFFDAAACHSYFDIFCYNFSLNEIVEILNSRAPLHPEKPLFAAKKLELTSRGLKELETTKEYEKRVGMRVKIDE